MNEFVVSLIQRIALLVDCGCIQCHWLHRVTHSSEKEPTTNCPSLTVCSKGVRRHCERRGGCRIRPQQRSKAIIVMVEKCLPGTMITTSTTKRRTRSNSLPTGCRIRQVIVITSSPSCIADPCSGFTAVKESARSRKPLHLNDGLTPVN